MKVFGRRIDFAESPDQPVSVPTEPAPADLDPAIETIARLRESVIEQIDPGVASELPAPLLRAQLEQLVHQTAGKERMQLTAREEILLAEELTNDMAGYGPLQPLLADDAITDIMVNGPYNIYVEKRGKLQRAPVRFRDSQHAASVAQKIAAGVGRRIDESSPMVDARLPDGSRVNVVFPPLALDGPCFSIRKFAKRKIDFNAMVANGSITEPVARVLEIAARCRLNIVVSGGTGSGKTTMLNAMSRLIDPDERIVTIEDAAELQLQQPHVVRLETRPVNLEGRGEITQRDLLRNALRMRPDRIIVGEVRGAEAFDMLQAMNTGHDGSFCTVHANTTRDAVVRIENMVQMGSFSLPPRAIRTQIASAVDVIVQVERMRDGVRRVSQVSEVCGLEGDVITMNDVFAFQYEGEDGNGRLRGRYRTTQTRPSFVERLEYFGLASAWMDALRGAER